MNSFGYDYYTYNDYYNYDDNPYAEQIKPMDKIENFSNEIDSMLNTNDQSALQKAYSQTDYYCKALQQKYKDCVMALRQKTYEMQSNDNTIFLLYILLIFSIVFIFYQRMTISNLQQLIYILKWNSPSIIEKKL